MFFSDDDVAADGSIGIAVDDPEVVLAAAAAADPLCGAVAAAVDALQGDDPAVLGFAAQRGRLVAVGRLIDRLEAERCRLVGVAERSGALSDDGGATAASWLRRHSSLTANQAAARARLARRLADLPVIAAAFAGGVIGVAHATQIDRLAADVGHDQVAGVQEEIVTAARRMRFVSHFAKVCTGWRHALRPDLTDGDDDRAYAKRRVNLSSTFEGEFHLSGLLDAEGGATLATAINAYMYPDPPDTPEELRRSIAQRRADALVDIARAALGADDAPNVAGVRPTVVARIDVADLINNPRHPNHGRLPGHRHDGTCCTHHDPHGSHGTHNGHRNHHHGLGGHDADLGGQNGHGGLGGDLGGFGGLGDLGGLGGLGGGFGGRVRAGVSPPTIDWGGVIGPAMLERLLSDCTIVRVVFNGTSQPLDVGAARRMWPVAVRRAITERDRGCRFDGCDRPPEWCDVDHIVPWSEHGPTSVDNGLLLCRHHHRAKRRDRWWPTLHHDGTVTWAHADGRTRTDPPPRAIDDQVRTLLHTTDDPADGDTRFTYRTHREPSRV